MNHFGPAIAIEVKNLDEAGYIEGIAASFGNIDYGNDRILPGAFSKSLARRSAVPMLRDHDQHKLIGRWGKAEEVDAGLRVEGRISVKTRDGAEAYELAKDQALEALSIGYRPDTKRMAGKVRELVDVTLHEVSLVPIGMDPHAGIIGVKGILEAGNLPSLPEFEEFLREAGFSKTQATAIAGKGLAPLLRSESGTADELVRQYLEGLRA